MPSIELEPPSSAPRWPTHSASFPADAIDANQLRTVDGSSKGNAGNPAASPRTGSRFCATVAASPVSPEACVNCSRIRPMTTCSAAASSCDGSSFVSVGGSVSMLKPSRTTATLNGDAANGESDAINRIARRSIDWPVLRDQSSSTRSSSCSGPSAVPATAVTVSPSIFATGKWHLNAAGIGEVVLCRSPATPSVSGAVPLATVR